MKRAGRKSRQILALMMSAALMAGLFSGVVMATQPEDDSSLVIEESDLQDAESGASGEESSEEDAQTIDEDQDEGQSVTETGTGEEDKEDQEDQKDQTNSDEDGVSEGTESEEKETEDGSIEEDGADHRDDMSGDEGGSSEQETVNSENDQIELTVPMTEEELMPADPANAAVEGLNVNKHSQDEIRSFFINHPAPYLTNTYAAAPSLTAPYSAGSLSAESQMYAMNALNQARFIAGIDANVVEDASYTSMVQAAALLNAVNRQLSHNPAKPEDMDNDLYELGASGAGSANIAWGSSSAADSMHLWMSDSDSSNIDRLGHRRWILNPAMKKSGFGAVNSYSAVYAFDGSFGSSAYSRVAWPAQNMPLEYFEKGDAWSVSFGKNVTASNVSVVLRRAGDGHEWNFSTASADGYFNVNNDYYGETGCVIFQPENVSYKNGDHFDVTITGADSCTVQYSVDFFEICGGDHDYDSETLSEATCESSGEIRKVCRICGDVDYEYPSALGHQYRQTGFTDGILTMHCDVCQKDIEGAVPSSFRPFWKDLSVTGDSSYYSYIPSGLEAGAQISVWMPGSYISYTADTDLKFSDFAVESDNENCVVQMKGTDMANLTFREAGSYNITIYPVYNPQVRRTSHITIVKALESASLQAQPPGPMPYGSQVNLTAAAEGGKGSLQFRFVRTEEDGTETVLQDYSTRNTCRWKPGKAGTYTLYVDVKDTGDQDRTLRSDAITFVIEKGAAAVKDGKAVKAAKSLVYGQPLADAGAENASFVGALTGEALTGEFSYDTPEAVLPAGKHRVTWTFTPDSQNYGPLTGRLEVTVNKAVPVITSNPAADTAVYHPNKKLGTISISGEGTANVEGTWEWVNADAALQVPGGSYQCRFVPKDTDNYETVEQEISVTVNKAVPYPASVQAQKIVYGDTLAKSSLTGETHYSADDSYKVPGTFAWADNSIRPTAADSGRTLYDYTFTPADQNNYETVSGQVTLTVDKADHPAQLPPAEISVPYSTATLTDSILRDKGIADWAFSAEYSGRALPIGKTLTASAVYTGSDAGNYKTETAEIKVTRSSCEHKGDKITRNKKDASCTEDGFTGDTYCSICSELLSSGTVIPATGHQWDDGKATKEPTLNSEGVRTFTCTVCKETKTGTIPKLINIAGAQITDIADAVFAGAALKPAVEVSLNNNILTEGVDYDLTFVNNINAGSGQVTVHGKGIYGGTLGSSFTILPASIEKASVTGIVDKTYTGKALTQTLTIKLGSVTLKRDSDYTISYKDNTEIGRATITISGKGNYEGTVTESFAIKAVGWNQVEGEWYYYNSDGTKLTNGWAKDSAGWCWMDADGKITKNKWILSGGQWYYLKVNGYMAANEWAKDSTGWCWMDSSGKITKNKWIQSGGQWYFLKANGYMAANEWAKDSTGWCWMDGSGKITKNKWIQSGGQWYFLKANGYMAANEWAKDSGGWYWMDASGKITKSKWIQTGGKWYYLGANGYMVTGTQNIGGKIYKFNSSGVWIQ